MSNILITSAGKRVSLVKIFQHELKRKFPTGKVFTADLKPQMAPAAIISDGWFAVPRVSEPGYVQKLLNICRENSIKVVIPTIDTELLILAEAKLAFENEGVSVIVADPDFIRICRDKRKTNQFFQQNNVKIPEQYAKDNLKFPLFAKPYDGSLSKDIFVVKTKEELTSQILEHPKLLFMEYIDPEKFQEFTVDLYYGADHSIKGIVPRERVEVRAGEINKGITRKNYIVRFLKDRLHHLPGVVGCICLQLFFNDKTNEIFGIEINPRFGGGFPLTYHAKANYPSHIIEEYIRGKSIGYSEGWLDNTLMLRHDNEVIIYDEQ